MASQLTCGGRSARSGVLRFAVGYGSSGFALEGTPARAAPLWYDAREVSG